MPGSLLADITPLKESPQYRLFYFGDTLSNIGRQLTLLAAPLQVYSLTDSTLLVGLLGLSQFPMLLVGSTVGGMLSDAFDRRRVLILAQITLALISVGLALNASSPDQRVWLVFVLTSLQAFFFSIDAPARMAAVPRLVKAKQIPAAYALQILQSQTSKAIGPLLGGVLIATWSLPLAYWIDAASFTIAIIAIYVMAPIPATGGGTRPGIKSMVEGFKFLRSRKAIQGAFLIDINATVFGVPRALFPEMGLSVFGGTAATVGLLTAMPGFGALIAAATSGWVSRVTRSGRATTIAVVLWGLTIAGFGFTRSLPIGLVFLALAGASDAISSVFRAAIIQLSTPDHLRGRLSGLKIAAVGGGPRLGDAEAGFVAERFTPSIAAWSGGLAAAIGALIIAKTLPDFYNWVAPPEGSVEDEAAERFNREETT